MARVRLFAALREIAGESRLDVDGATVDDVVRALGEKLGARFEEIARAGSVVVDGERAGFDRDLSGVEEVAFLPPVSGGAADGGLLSSRSGGAGSRSGATP
ncbi:MAG TPA: MoaD/ThiS family protein [Actinomycetota bacterium]